MLSHLGVEDADGPEHGSASAHSPKQRLARSGGRRAKRSPKLKAKGNAAAGESGGRKTTKKGQVQRRRCRKCFLGEVFGVNNVCCGADKKSLWRITTIVVGEGPEVIAFVSKARTEPELCL